MKKLQPRTVYNKFENVMSFLKANRIGGLASKNDWPRYVEDEPEIYEREDLDKFSLNAMTTSACGLSSF